MYKNMLKEMLLMQKNLNDETNGKGWENGYAKNGKLINWRRCIYMECAELIDSFSWKHWKDINSSPNIENIAVEITDIWHFIMSLVLENSYKNTMIDEIVENINAVSGFNEFYVDAYDISEYNIYEIINDIEVIIHDTSGFELKIYDLLTKFFRLSLKCGVNLSTLYKIYMGKNVLNKFRQDNGYQDGSYKKVWNGKEDNEVMSEILKTSNLSVEEIYKELSKFYKEIE
ncbi:dUTPase [Campylobacter sp. FMV-PI01]|uniref:dUTPase n=1 Tax=Campylobacter portucalensis TaxID=2608384 RepID=A0A6L5WGM8_9BACT|nr:dUTP diphosphatase [Campylobacter portucalensis]MSN96159.1 dUTPase [Campylobacter portucalensis]